MKDDPILQFAVRQLACGCSYGSFLYQLAVPLGQLDAWIFRMQDHWQVLNYIWSDPNLNPRVVRKPVQIDWAGQIAHALTIAKTDSTSNPYGIQDKIWGGPRVVMPSTHPGSADSLFRQDLRKSKEWTDFELVLQVLKELGVQPLILSRPIDGPIWGAMGVSWQARKSYYDELHRTVAAYGFAFADFASHDDDPYFSADRASHASPEGWAYVDQTLDGFFHGTMH